MTRFFSAVHPTFESLSAFIDLTDAQAARARIVRHLKSCTECSTAVADLRRLGEDARAIPDQPIPGCLWERIVSAPRVVTAPEVSLPPTATSGGARRWSIRLSAVAAAAAIVVGVSVFATNRLDATSLERLVITPGRPVPGSTITVRYRPSDLLRNATHLILVGRVLPEATGAIARSPADDMLGDSVATLVRGSTGDFEGRVQLPPDALVMEFAVIDSAGERADVTDKMPEGARVFPWAIAVGTKDRKPSHAAFTAGLPRREVYWLNGVEVTNYASAFADSLVKYFPDDPAGWAYRASKPSSNGMLGFLNWFESSERRYATLSDRLKEEPNVGAGQLHDMAEFAWRIEEPELAAGWVDRLVREHPEYPTAAADYARRLHEMELENPSNAAEIVRPQMVLLDSLLELHPEAATFEVRDLFERYGNDVMRNRSRLRFAMAHAAQQFFPGDLDDSMYRAIPVTVEAGLVASLQRECLRPEGRYPFGLSVSEWVHACETRRGRAFASMSHMAFARNEMQLALELADSSIALMYAHAPCWQRSPSVRIPIELARGDTRSATDDAAAVFTEELPTTFHRAQVILRTSALDSAYFLERLHVHHEERIACFAAEKARSASSR
jgi:hypothetical protein